MGWRATLQCELKRIPTCVGISHAFSNNLTEPSNAPACHDSSSSISLLGRNVILHKLNDRILVRIPIFMPKREIGRYQASSAPTSTWRALALYAVSTTRIGNATFLWNPRVGNAALWRLPYQGGLYLPPLTEGDVVEPNEVFRHKMDYFSLTRKARAMLGQPRCIAGRQRSPASMAAPCAVSAALLPALADSVEHGQALR